MNDDRSVIAWVLIALLLLLLVIVEVKGQPIRTAGQTNVVLGWSYPAGQNVVGFNLYHGPESRQYTQTQFIAGAESRTATATIADDAPTFFAVTATNAGGLESAFSQEAVFGWTFPVPRVTGTNSVLLTVEESDNPTNHWHKLVNATNTAGFYRLKIEGPFIEP